MTDRRVRIAMCRQWFPLINSRSLEWNQVSGDNTFFVSAETFDCSPRMFKKFWVIAVTRKKCSVLRAAAQKYLSRQKKRFNSEVVFVIESGDCLSPRDRNRDKSREVNEVTFNDRINQIQFTNPNLCRSSCSHQFVDYNWKLPVWRSSDSDDGIQMSHNRQWNLALYHLMQWFMCVARYIMISIW